MTQHSEIENLIGFKVQESALRKKYPFIKKIKLRSPQDLDKGTALWFVNIYFDPWILESIDKGIEVAHYISKENLKPMDMNLSVYFMEPGMSIDKFFNERGYQSDYAHDYLKPLEIDITNDLDLFYKELPEKYRLPKKLYPFGWIAVNSTE